MSLSMLSVIGGADNLEEFAPVIDLNGYCDDFSYDYDDSFDDYYDDNSCDTSPEAYCPDCSAFDCMCDAYY